ncbi:L,D-transpeptidase family protein [Nakamurella sp. YIM 132087]|uniref:L,D-transpeptidase family protein n=1 Tax=Nakamurella alba TaxID=2665158 RepID=A0A7K1FEY3_9ACTN|nr:Ig-like domain-containing protein [Nakamurella alba]MTD12667.1 L,D-transpeptidase family protein [Nakamurella alba]
MTGRRMRLMGIAAAALACVLVAAGCSPSSGQADVTDPAFVTTPATTAAASTPSSSQVTVTVPAGTTSDTASGGSTSTTPEPTTPTTPSTSSSTPPPVPAAKVTTTPATGSKGISPVAPISVKVAEGTLQKVSLKNSQTGVTVEGKMAADKLSWTVTPELGYGKNYTLTSTAVNAEGKASTHETTFATITPDNQTDASTFPRDGWKVGVGQPVSVVFDEPITDKKAAQDAITISTNPKQEGAFRWFSDSEVHWRPKVYWKPGTKVSVKVDIYGKDLGGGLYGMQDEAFSFTVGDSMIAEIDDNSKIMVIKKNGAVIKEMPVSLGSNTYPTYNGVHVVAESYEEKIMDSSTWGLTGTGAYRTRVEWAVRISSTGEFVHAAPWSVWAQGSENVSHGCVNVSTENAKWFYDNFTFGDIVDIKNTVGTDLQSWDGYGDWQLSWDVYRQGSA